MGWGMFCVSSCLVCFPLTFRRDGHHHHCPLTPQTLRRCLQRPKEDTQNALLLEVSFVISLDTFLISENRNVASNEWDPHMHQDTAQSLLISCGTGKGIFHWTENILGARCLAYIWRLSFYFHIHFRALSFLLSSSFWRSHPSHLGFLSLSILRLPWAYEHHKRFQWQC